MKKVAFVEAALILFEETDERKNECPDLADEFDPVEEIHTPHQNALFLSMPKGRGISAHFGDAIIIDKIQINNKI